MKNKMILLALVAVMAGACNNSESISEGEIPRNIPSGDNIDSMHRYPTVPDTDSMIDPRTGQPKTAETDTI